MANSISREPVIVESGRVDASILPSSFSFALKDALVNQSSDIVSVADKANQSGSDAENAVNTNLRQDIDIQENKQGVAANRVDIDKNITAIAKNTQDIAINTQTSSENKKKIDTHVASDSAHGASGNVIGSMDFCSLINGGVALLAVEVADLIVTAPSAISSAPASYDQTHTQSMVDAINKLSSNQGLIINSINLLIESLQNAKQMQKNQP